MWCGSRAWLRPSCGFVSVLGLSLLGLGRGALVLPVCVSGWLLRGSLNSTRGPGFMSMRTLKWILLVGSLRNPLVLVSGCVSIISGKGGGPGFSSVGLGLGGMSCFVFPSCLVRISVPLSWITLATGFCLLPRLLPLPLGPRLALVIGRSYLLRPINLLSVSGGVGMSGSGITSVGLALVVLHRLLSDLFAPSLQGLDGSPKIQAGSLIRSLRCGTGWPPASLVSGRLRRLR